MRRKKIIPRKGQITLFNLSKNFKVFVRQVEFDHNIDLMFPPLEAIKIGRLII